MIPFDDKAMMVMLELPDMPDMNERHLDKGPMEGMPESDAEEILKRIYCMLKEHFGDKCEDEEDDGEEAEDEL